MSSDKVIKELQKLRDKILGETSAASADAKGSVVKEEDKDNVKKLLVGKMAGLARK